LTEASAKVCFYTTPSPDYAAEIISAFEKAHPGTTVVVVHDHAARFFSRTLQECVEGRCPADIMLLNRQQAEALKHQGLLEPYRSPEGDCFPPRAQDADGFSTQVFMVPFSLAYHTGKLSRDEVPRRYEALLEARWRGELLFPDPRLSGSGSGWFALMKDELGEDYLRRLAGQRLICKQHAEDCLVAGEGSILVAAMIDRIERLKIKGVPVDWIPMPAMMVAGPHAVLFRHARNREGGKKLIDFFLSQLGQTIMSRYHIPNRPGIEMRDPLFADEIKRLEGCRLLTFNAHHGRDYEINQAQCVELFSGGR
jgi:iron(III) transport system substrate-binding protein